MRAQDPLGRTRGAPWPEARALVAFGALPRMRVYGEESFGPLASIVTGGRAALEEFTELRWITVQDTERHYPI